MSVAESSLSTAVAPRLDRATSDRLAGVLQRPLLGVLPIDVEKAAYGGVLLVAALLGPRSAHAPPRREPARHLHLVPVHGQGLRPRSDDARALPLRVRRADV